jgi:putative ABC transport system permease protein
MLSDWTLRIRALFRPAAVNRDIDDELRFHLERQIETYVSRGLERGAATRRAKMEFGGLDQIKDEYRDALGIRLADDVSRDVRAAARSLRATPIVTAVALASLALGIGANTAIFSIVNGLLLRTLPVNDPERLVLVSDTRPTGIRVWSYPVWQQIHARTDLFERSAAWSFFRFNLASGGETQFVDGMWASGSFFETLGVSPLIGRPFSDADDLRRGDATSPVAVLSYGFWQRRFGGSADVVGKPLILDGVPFTITGVMPADFSGPEVGRAFDVVVPIADEPLIRGADTYLDQAGSSFLTIIGRLRRNESLEAATAALRSVQPQIREATIGELLRIGNRQRIDRYLKEPFTLARGATGDSDLRGAYERPLLTLMAIVAVLLLIACVNLANLLMARATARRHELSLRLALGASRWQLARQLGVEAIVLTMAGAALGMVLASFGSQLLVQQLSTPANKVFLDVSIDGRVLVFTAVIAMATALLFGTAPAVRASRQMPIDALKEHGRSSQLAHSSLGGWLVVAQVALSVVLVVAAGLFGRTFTALAGRPLGFQPDQVLVTVVDAKRATVDPTSRLQLYSHIRDAIRELPDVADAAVSLITPLANEFTPPIEIADVPPSDGRGRISGNLISPGWFTTFGTPVVVGRDFTDRDRTGSPRVAIVNEAFARMLLNGVNPIGRTIALYPHSSMMISRIEIVGVVGDAVYGSLHQPVPPTWYVPLAQFDVPGFSSDLASVRLSVRSRSGSPVRLTKTIAAAITRIDPRLAVTSQVLADRVKASLLQEHLIAMLAAIFGGLALLLAGLGLYGITAYTVANRRAEIGIRMALGSASTQVVWLVLARTAARVAAGLTIGIIISTWTGRLVAGLLYGIGPGDPATLAGATAALAAVAAVAAWLPARRAARMDPAIVLRES